MIEGRLEKRSEGEWKHGGLWMRGEVCLNCPGVMSAKVCVGDIG